MTSASSRIAGPASGAIRVRKRREREPAGSTTMTETTSETTSLDFELVAQAARLVAPVSNGPVRNRRVLPVPPPPPSVWAVASTQESARTPAPSDVADLLAWEEAAEQLEPDWATPGETTKKLPSTRLPGSEVSGEPSGEATKLPLIAIEASDPPKALDAGTLDAIAIVEANMAAAAPAEARSNPRTRPADADAPSLKPPKRMQTEAESELEALARAVTKNALDTLAARAQAPGRPLSTPPLASRARADTTAAARSKSPASSSTCEPDAPARLHGHALDAGPDAAARRHGTRTTCRHFLRRLRAVPYLYLRSLPRPTRPTAPAFRRRPCLLPHRVVRPGHARDRSASPAADVAADG